MTHTPGPWKVYGGAYKFVVARPIPNHKPAICELPDSEPETAEERANANLIAAAPDLLEALKDCVEFQGCGDPDCCDAARAQVLARQRARAAIAKAEGR